MHTYIHINVYTYIHMCICAYICICMYVFVCVCVCMFACVCVCDFLCECTCNLECVHVRLCACVCTCFDLCVRLRVSFLCVCVCYCAHCVCYCVRVCLSVRGCSYVRGHIETLASAYDGQRVFKVARTLKARTASTLGRDAAGTNGRQRKLSTSLRCTSSWQKLKLSGLAVYVRTACRRRGTAPRQCAAPRSHRRGGNARIDIVFERSRSAFDTVL